MTKRFAHFPILLVFGLLTSGVGCQVLPFPSYRAEYRDANGVGESNVSAGAMGNNAEILTSDDYCTAQCTSGFLPPLAAVPVPGWWAKWRSHRNLPDPAPYPRFHPLPTRPMFQPAAEAPPAGPHDSFLAD